MRVVVWCELQKGMQEHMWLGQKLAGKYVQDLKFIDEHYKSNEIYVRSTDFNRTLISAISNFIGFYSKTSKAGVDYPLDPAWPQGYLPIPIHTVDDRTDFLGNPDRECPRVTALTKLWADDKAVQDAQKQFEPLFANLTKQCGEEITWDNIWNVYDSLFVEKRYNLTVSPGLDALYSQIKAASDLDTDWIDGIGLTPLGGIDFKIEMPKIRGGPLLWALIEHMQGKVKCVNDSNKTSKKTPEHRPGQLVASEDYSDYCAWMNPLKYYVYSAHDSTVSALFSALGFKQSNWNETGFPHYSSCVTVELWQKPDKTNYVK
ncbi:esophageal gland cell secretory protein 21, partial [Aphelenchoides avenae]